MTPVTLEELRDLAPAYVMGTLSLEERRAFDTAMADAATAEAMRPELDAHREALAYLADSQAKTPPAGLKERMLARIATERPDGLAVSSPGSSTHANANTNARTPEPALDMRQQERRTADRRNAGAVRATRVQPPIAPAAHAAHAAHVRGGANGAWWSAGVLAVGLAAAVLFAVDLQDQVKSLDQRLREQVALYRRSSTELAERERTLAALLDGGNDLTLVRLTANAPEGPGMQLFWNVREGRAIVNATGLAQVRADRAYCLWIIRDGKPEPVKLFTVDADGRALIRDIVLPRNLAGVAAFAVTEEPATGSPAPTMTPFLVGAVPKS